MNIVCDISKFQVNQLYFLDTKKNMVINGNFTKIIYSVSSVTLNGIYLLFPIEFQSSSKIHAVGSHIVNFSFSNSRQVSEHSTKLRHNVALLRSGSATGVEHCAVLGKDSGTESFHCAEAGIPTRASLPGWNSTNIHIIKELNRIEHEIIEYYKEFFHINKVNVYSLRNQLKSGTLKVYRSSVPQDTDVNVSPHTMLKISGVWETEYNVGLTYKFLA